MNTPRRVTLFGGTGFIGRYIVKILAEQGAVITVVGRTATHALNLKAMGDVGQIALVNGSITNEILVQESVEGSDAVINLVGVLAENGRQRFETLHHTGPAAIARIAAGVGVARFIQFSALGADAASASSYARSKALGEAGVLAAFPAATILRPSIVFGPEDNFFNRFARMAALSPFLPLIGGGHAKFQPAYVVDIAEAVSAVLADPATAGRTYELGGPEVLSFRALMEKLLLIIDREEEDRLFRRHALLNIPFPIAELMAGVAQFAPGAPLTRDQVTLLKHDNVVSPGSLGFADLDIAPTALDLILPSYLDRYRTGGWYSSRKWA